MGNNFLETTMQSFIYVLRHIYMCSNTYGVFMGKKTTTLTLDEETVEKAKKMNINISELTETVLKGFTFEPSEVEEKALKSEYKQLFAAILPILKRQNIIICVGNLWSDVMYPPNAAGEERKTYECLSRISLSANGRFYLDNFDEEIDLEKTDDNDIIFQSPKQILSNLIKSIDDRKERRKEEIKEIEMVKRIVEALYPTFAKK